MAAVAVAVAVASSGGGCGWCCTKKEGRNDTDSGLPRSFLSSLTYKHKTDHGYNPCQMKKRAVYLGRDARPSICVLRDLGRLQTSCAILAEDPEAHIL